MSYQFELSISPDNGRKQRHLLEQSDQGLYYLSWHFCQVESVHKILAFTVVCSDRLRQVSCQFGLSISPDNGRKQRHLLEQSDQGLYYLSWHFCQVESVHKILAFTVVCSDRLRQVSCQFGLSISPDNGRKQRHLLEQSDQGLYYLSSHFRQIEIVHTKF